ncbi:MAG: hypothetical protein CL947_03450 [Epsilonproteobacteria bacterium]|nr:hypothetical protein [Campylobacterota bacterium]|tara:strand:- start:4048 stop:4503 length:456 start_codon:yes stop_codon:yes gene_type:complete
MLYQFFIVLQTILFFYITLHDWIEARPFTDIQALRSKFTVKKIAFGSLVYTLIIGIPLYLTIAYPEMSLVVAGNICIFYALTTLGTILSWWVPYFFGSSSEHKKEFAIFKNTHTFLPIRGTNVVPNTLHVILHVQIWLCCIISFYYLYKAL